jgi:hypothetical protein
MGEAVAKVLRCREERLIHEPDQLGPSRDARVMIGETVKVASPERRVNRPVPPRLQRNLCSSPEQDRESISCCNGPVERAVEELPGKPPAEDATPAQSAVRFAEELARRWDLAEVAPQQRHDLDTEGEVGLLGSWCFAGVELRV